ncbi:MAG: hypothetical protein J2O49_05340 [Sciscionella sp.]|nr:hypothetical protein [Sciscionella sp.]
MDVKWRGDYRPDGNFAHLRTACHGCRHVTQAHIESEDGSVTIRPMVIAGDGTIYRETGPGQVVSQPCPECGETDHPGWISGFCLPL